MANLQFTRYQDQRVSSIWTRDQAGAAEGSYFVATNPTPQTGIALTASKTAEVQTTPDLLIQNNYSTSDVNAKDIIPIRLTMLWTAIPTSITYLQAVIRLDNTAAKYTSGGSTLAPKNTNTRYGNTTGAVAYAGAITGLTANATDGRLVYNGMVSPTVPVIKDSIVFEFGSAAGTVSYENTASVNSVHTVVVPPVVIGPQWWFYLNMFGGSSSGGSPAVELVLEYVER